jgi:6-phosphogluconolactonase (cycloisomerase 2 family)
VTSAPATVILASATTPEGRAMFAYVGGYTTPDRDGRGNGINVYRIAPTGAWTHVQHIGGLENPSLFTLRRDAARLYAVHGGRNLVSGFARDAASGQLTLLGQVDSRRSAISWSATTAPARWW